MKIVVCVKQVPDIADVQVDRETGTLIRQGVAAALNPFCEYALDHAVRLTDDRGEDEITAVSMGPPQARTALLRCLELGARRAVLASDFAFAGADTWATALTLSAVVRKVVPDFDLVFVGKQAVDGDTAQVGPELAEILGIPQVLYGVEASLAPGGRRIRVRREIDRGYEIVEAKLPALVSFTRGEDVKRIPSFAAVLNARRRPLSVVGAAQLGLAESELGLAGSYTQVVDMFPPAAKPGGTLLEGLDPETAARRIASFLRERQLIGQQDT